MDGRVPHSAAHAALRAGAADVGRQLLPQHPADPRARPTGRRCRASSTWGGCRRPASCAASSWQTPRNFKLLPYVVSSANRNFTPGADTDLDGDFGFDAKFGVTPSLNLDLTYNTDFAQVEVDTQQINLTRFNLRFPEKRPFFLENSGLFTIGKGSELDLFFSRRIGLDENGELVPIRAAARLSGKIGGVNVGVLNMQTEDVGDRPGNNFSVLRVSRELPSRSGVGAHVRQPDGDRRSGGGRATGTGRGAPTRGSASASTSPMAGFARAHGNAGPDRPRLRLQRRLRVRRRDQHARRVRVRA